MGTMLEIRVQRMGARAKLTDALQILILMQAVFMIRERYPPRAFQQGAILGLSTGCLVARLIVEIFTMPLWYNRTIRINSWSVQWTSMMLQAVAGCIVVTSSFAMPRRPAVFHNGSIVDGQFTTSLLER